MYGLILQMMFCIEEGKTLYAAMKKIRIPFDPIKQVEYQIIISLKNDSDNICVLTITPGQVHWNHGFQCFHAFIGEIHDDMVSINKRIDFLRQYEFKIIKYHGDDENEKTTKTE